MLKLIGDKLKRFFKALFKYTLLAIAWWIVIIILNKIFPDKSTKFRVIVSILVFVVPYLIVDWFIRFRKESTCPKCGKRFALSKQSKNYIDTEHETNAFGNVISSTKHYKIRYKCVYCGHEVDQNLYVHKSK